MIDARDTEGVPCITTCKTVLSRSVMDRLDLDLTDWQERLVTGWGFAFTR
ncbi:hypothetical protein QE375_001603 [Microbacterium foliorum]|uniref:Uncharacterized protein n=1 Tax=Microbacterium foliorum TaxID=104336 RepID=A0ABU1HRW1_9MICO|nr:hypothetical protein [Microbacterium foliorum]MDR6142049.1 hypothetical protein [Microbacterium foliorum]